ncbi:hypothetical protein R0131_16110 [Clostridium sp. AL.422]|uniref:hypothetical protein n=1 Tax=Clostridium TaxID=1485 RepID=UPI00293DF532|nr:MULTISPECIES: hypothetical protein [unclassified Clostridium]MDV4152351.1 hypothetical protein [Clostridium sp. AL.422]
MKKVMPFLFTGNFSNLRNIAIYVNNNTSKELTDVTIYHTGSGGHPIKLGTIKPNTHDNIEQIASTMITNKSELIFSYTLDDNNYSLVVYDDLINTDIRPLIIEITEESNSLVFNSKRISGEYIK